MTEFKPVEESVEDSSVDDKRGPAVRFPPPLVFLAFLLGASELEFIYPLAVPPGFGFTLLAVLLVLIGLSLILSCIRAYKLAQTSIKPWTADSKLITSGLYTYSRNPTYLGMSLLSAGIGLALGSIWLALSFLPAGAMVYFLAIRKEERYLMQKFGAEYKAYKEKVRMWL